MTVWVLFLARQTLLCIDVDPIPCAADSQRLIQSQRHLRVDAASLCMVSVRMSLAHPFDFFFLCFFLLFHLKKSSDLPRLLRGLPF